MQVGGLAMHWGGVTPRFSPEDFKHKSLLRRRHRLADLVRRSRSVLPGSGRDDGRRRRTGPARPRSAQQAVPDAGAAADLQPRAAQEVGVEAPASRCGASRRRRIPSRTAGARSAVATIRARRSARSARSIRRTSRGMRFAQTNKVRVVAAHARAAASCSTRAENGSRTPSPSIATIRTIPSSSRETCSSSPRATPGARTCCCCRRRRARRTASRIARGSSASISRAIATCRRYIDLPLRLYPGHQRAAQSRDEAVHAARSPASAYIRHDLRVWESSVGQDAASRRRQRRAHARRRDPRRLAQAHAAPARRACARTTTSFPIARAS